MFTANGTIGKQSTITPSTITESTIKAEIPADNFLVRKLLTRIGKQGQRNSESNRHYPFASAAVGKGIEGTQTSTGKPCGYSPKFAFQRRDTVAKLLIAELHECARRHVGKLV